jgi:hypothetical protein
MDNIGLTVALIRSKLIVTGGKCTKKWTFLCCSVGKWSYVKNGHNASTMEMEAAWYVHLKHRYYPTNLYDVTTQYTAMLTPP